MVFLWLICVTAAKEDHPKVFSLPFTTTRSKQQWTVTQSALESTMGCVQSENTHNTSDLLTTCFTFYYFSLLGQWTLSTPSFYHRGAMLASCSFYKYTVLQFFFLFCLWGVNSHHHTRPGISTGAISVLSSISQIFHWNTIKKKKLKRKRKNPLRKWLFSKCHLLVGVA